MGRFAAMRSTAIAALCALALAAAAGCGDGEAPAVTSPPAPAAAPAGTPVTDEQAVVLARLLQRNYEDGGARVTGDFPFSKTARVLVDGQMDWRKLRGTMRILEPGRPAGAARRYFWTRDVVLAQAAPGEERYRQATPDPERVPAHFLISSLALLSSENIDNVALIKDQGSRFLRRDALRGEPVDVYQYGSAGKNEYWVGVGDGRLRRVQLDLPKLGGTGTLDFTRRGRQAIELPPASARESA